MTDLLRIGHREIPFEEARKSVTTYMGGRGVDVYAYPSYDGYATEADLDHLCDGDLLAPVLLNVQVKLRTYAELRDRIPELEARLQQVPALPIWELEEVDCDRIAAVFGILDGATAPWGALMTTLAKILHRKRPATIPLYDELVRSLYQPSPIPIDRTRSWAAFASLYCKAVRSDLRSNLDAWKNLADMTPEGQPAITPLRALDIVAWRAGRDGLGTKQPQ